MATVLWVLVAIVVLGASTVIGMHIRTVAKLYPNPGLMPWHVTCLAIALVSFATCGPLFLMGYIPLAVALFSEATAVSLIAFAIVIENLRKRLKHAT